MRRQLKLRNARVEVGAEEKGDRQPIPARWRRDDAMHIGAQEAIGSDLQEFADIDDKGSINRRPIDPAAFPLDLKPCNLVLKEDRDETAIFVRADALIGLVGGSPGIADDFCELVRPRRMDRLEDVLLLL